MIIRPGTTIEGATVVIRDGLIEAIGKDVTKYKVGDVVFASTFAHNFGGYAEYKCISENASISIMPNNKTFEEAVSFVDGSTTALFFLKEKAKIKPKGAAR